MSRENWCNLKQEIIGFRRNEKVETVVDIDVIGLETRNSPEYRWHGRERQGRNSFVFQYTLSGEGAIDIHETTYRLTKGKAFMVEIPGDHCYYLPDHSPEWEFIFITLRGEEAKHCWDRVLQRYGPVLDISLYSRVMEKLFDIYIVASEENFDDAYMSSAESYSFLMECYRLLKPTQAKSEIPDSLNRAVSFINQHYHTYVTIDEIANAANVSKYHLIKLFQKSLNITPGHYVTNKRIEKAIELMVNTDFTIKTIAEKVGFANDNYFNKVFRKVVGIPPGEFRKNKNRMPFERIVIH
ncbi:helix-turn-helix domain-containing protein [Salipaludibacillus sp. HK11]|uniref:helix-turn-helix transcriptional regulator n=1 Tax=Salipaludibacillus sp. HK11 TaxID=3394320 RepID=UPI0039FCA819